MFNIPGGTMDVVTRPGSLKKFRGGATPTKTTPSPIKATYRPMSMPVDHLVPNMEEDSEGRNTPEEGNSGKNLSKTIDRKFLHWKGMGLNFLAVSFTKM